MVVCSAAGNVKQLLREECAGLASESRAVFSMLSVHAQDLLSQWNTSITHLHLNSLWWPPPSSTPRNSDVLAFSFFDVSCFRHMRIACRSAQKNSCVLC